MDSAVTRQIEIELAASNEGILRGIEQVQLAFEQGRAADTPVGKRLLMQAYEEGLPLVTEAVNAKSAGVGGKYRALLRRVSPEILTVLGLRQIISACADPDEVLLQDILRNIGRAAETESIISRIADVNEYYVQKVEAQVQTEASRSIGHIQRKYRTGAKDVGVDVDPWTDDEKIQTGRIILTALYDLGLFEFHDLPSGKGKPFKVIAPSEALRKHLVHAVEAAHALMRFPPMVCKPRPWTSYNSGGYITEQMGQYAPMMSIRGMRKSMRDWVIDNLGAGCATVAKAAANRAQSVAYRVNKHVLQVARKAIANPQGILGLPAHGSKPKPVFPLGDHWTKEEATPAELDEFLLWKGQMKAWYTEEKQRVGKKVGLINKFNELVKYQDEPRLYFPTFFDWRGRLYFRSSINPQSHDTIKGILEFAEGKRLGKRGLFWLKVHIANCCGYDKKDFSIRAKWTEDNWGYIQDFINDPLNSDAPENDTAFTLLAAALAYQEALELPNPEDYICHVPCAQDATCSGLQHFSAMFRDPVGAKYTNLIDTGKDEKEDIYRGVSAVAKPLINEYETDPVVQHWWKERSIPRSMSKRPVMTYVYGSTLQSTMDYVVEDLVKQGEQPMEGYSLHRLGVPVAKALREGVEQSVPAAAAGMQYLRALVRASAEPLRWVSPAGIPVINWTEKHEVKQQKILSMGVTNLLMRKRTGMYDKVAGANGISPNFVHSLDSAHLCLTLVHFAGQVVPIHDSFATHMCDVDDMHYSLRKTFADMYSVDITTLLDELNTFKDKPEKPKFGSLVITQVLTSRFMFC